MGAPSQGSSAATVPGAPAAEALEAPAPPAAPAAASPAKAAPTPQAGAIAMSSAARAAQRSAHLPRGTVIDQKYSIERVLGEGGMGVVYLAEDIHTRTPVVLKAVRSDLAHRKDVRERTLAEGRALAQIDHPNVVHLNAVVVEGEGLWLVMQYIDGESLERRIRRYIEEKRPMPVDEALSVFRQIVAGVNAAHREGLIHRDLKPANVLIRSKDGTAKVTDFGIAKVEDDARAGKGMTKGIIGSLWYMSPEQVTGRRDLDKRVDVYALGIVLYEMLVGRVPFDADSDHEIMRQHIQAPVPLISHMRRDVPEAIDAMIQKACAKDREGRFADAEEVMRALDGLASAGPRASAISVDERASTSAAEAPRARASADVKTTASDDEPLKTTPADAAPEPTAKAKGSRAWIWVVAAVAVLGSGGAALVALGVVPGLHLAKPRAPARADAIPSAPSSAPLAASSQRAAPPPAKTSVPSAQASASAAPSAPPKPPLEALVGPWVSNGRDLDAVLSGNELEFRVRDPAQFDPQGYEQGEARFALLEIPGETRVFSVEDRVRPIPPAGKTYDVKRSRSACREIWTQAGGQPLKATFDGARLTVEFAKIEPKASNFIIEKGTITSCIGLRKLPTAKVVSALTRP